MDTLLTISVGQYQAVELTLKLCVALMGLMGLLLAASAACVERHDRFPLILGGAALAAVTWFEWGVLGAWDEAFELAGTSYCVTGHLLATGDRVTAWAVGVPLLLFALRSPGLFPSPPRRGPGSALAPVLLLGMAAASLLSGLLLSGLFTAWIVILWRCRDPKPILLREIRLATLSVLTALLLTWVGSKGLLPMGRTADSVLVRGEILRTLADGFSFVIPGALLLVGILGHSVRKTVSAGTR